MKFIEHRREQEGGQAIVLIAAVLVVLIAAVGLAIDGGGMFLLYRDVQNATDSAALSAAFAMCTGDNPETAGRLSARINGFEDGVDNASVTIVSPPPTGEAFAGDSDYVFIKIEAEKPAYFIQVVYPYPLKVSAQTIAQCKNAGGFGWPDSAAMIGLSQGCAASAGGAQTAAINVTGGKTLIIQGGILYVDTTDTGCTNGSVDTDGGGQVNADICVDGPVDPAANITGNVTTPCDSDQIVYTVDPYVDAGLAPPDCSGSGTYSGLVEKPATNQPGTYTNFDISSSMGNGVYLESGIYCIDVGGSNDVSWANDIETHPDGVFLYFGAGDGVSFSGPDSVTAGGGGTQTVKLIGLIDEDSDYNNLLMWIDDRDQAITNTTVLTVNAQASINLEGTIYAPRKHCNFQGQANGQLRGQAICWTLSMDGGSVFTIIFDDARSFDIPPEFGVTQ